MISAYQIYCLFCICLLLSCRVLHNPYQSLLFDPEYLLFKLQSSDELKPDGTFTTIKLLIITYIQDISLPKSTVSLSALLDSVKDKLLQPTIFFVGAWQTGLESHRVGDMYKCTRMKSAATATLVFPSFPRNSFSFERKPKSISAFLVSV